MRREAYVMSRGGLRNIIIKWENLGGNIEEGPKRKGGKKKGLGGVLKRGSAEP